ncbi:MAG: ASCH domain-containing protein, partial [Acidobacteriota bacterium]
DTLSVDHPHRHGTASVISFGDSPALADELAELVLSGRKRATASLPIEFTSQGERLPAVGDVSIVTRADNSPVAIIELVEVRLVAFQAVDAAFAAVEGEGDGSLSWWRAAHRRYFSRVCKRLGGQFEDATPVLCQVFRVAWPSDGEFVA